jgi:hypothetical protein
LFEYLFKIVGIPTGYAKTVDDNERIEKVRRELQFEKISQQDKTVRSFPEYRYISLRRGPSGLFQSKVTEEDYRGIPFCCDK